MQVQHYHLILFYYYHGFHYFVRKLSDEEFSLKIQKAEGSQLSLKWMKSVSFKCTKENKQLKLEEEDDKKFWTCTLETLCSTGPVEGNLNPDKAILHSVDIHSEKKIIKGSIEILIGEDYHPIDKLKKSYGHFHKEYGHFRPKKEKYLCKIAVKELESGDGDEATIDDLTVYFDVFF